MLYDFHSQCNLDLEKEKLRIVETAARLITEDIKAMKTWHSSYPSVGRLQSAQSINFLPNTLRVLLAGILDAEKGIQTKIVTIGQATMQAARPNVLLTSLQIGLSVQGIDSLHKHSFCCSYNEVQQFEWNAELSYGTDITDYSSQFVQYVADNVDHNIRTLDGNNSFHGIGDDNWKKQSDNKGESYTKECSCSNSVH